MQIVVVAVPTDWPDALLRVLHPRLAGQFVLDGERFDVEAAVVHRSDEVERDRRGCNAQENGPRSSCHVVTVAFLPVIVWNVT